MAFPTNPTNGQQATNNGVIYTYDSTLTAWTVGTGSGANISANSINVTSSVAVGTTLTVTGATILSSTASVTGNITSSGNISGTYVLGNVAFATGIPATYGNSNVVTLLTTYGSNTISTTGNVSVGNLTVTGNIVDTGALSILTSANGNISLSPNGTGVVIMTANTIPSANATYDLGSTTARWKTVFTSDLDLNNGIGDWTIVEGEDDLFLYNNKKSRVYKFALVEVDPKLATPKIDRLK